MERVISLLKQYRYGVLVLLIGIGLLLMPGQNPPTSQESPLQEEITEDVSDSLEAILARIDGVGKTSVFMTEAQGPVTVYQTDTDTSAETSREDTVVITSDSRAQAGLVRQIIPAKYRGAIVVCQGGDRASIKLAVKEAVSAVTGLTSDKITVLKMK